MMLMSGEYEWDKTLWVEIECIGRYIMMTLAGKVKMFVLQGSERNKRETIPKEKAMESRTSRWSMTHTIRRVMNILIIKWMECVILIRSLMWMRNGLLILKEWMKGTLDAQEGEQLNRQRQSEKELKWRGDENGSMHWRIAVDRIWCSVIQRSWHSYFDLFDLILHRLKWKCVKWAL